MSKQGLSKRALKKIRTQFGTYVLRHLFSPVKEQDLFPQNVVLHFSYHKCLTAYYNSIMSRLCAEFNLVPKHFNSDYEKFEEEVCKTSARKRVLSVNNTSDIRWDKFPEYRGSHFIRDPRDLIVSGYYYHLWTDEHWWSHRKFDWAQFCTHPYFAKYICNSKDKYPSNTSYKNYLNTLDKEKGFILEIIWRDHKLFDQLRAWNFDNPNIIELKYEDIINNEVESFRRIFEHYQFHEKFLNRGLEIVDSLSLKNKVKSNTGHVRKGTPSQWRNEFPPLVKDLFKERCGDLLIKLEYEQDLDW